MTVSILTTNSQGGTALLIRINTSTLSPAAATTASADSVITVDGQAFDYTTFVSSAIVIGKQTLFPGRPAVTATARRYRFR